MSQPGVSRRPPPRLCPVIGSSLLHDGGVGRTTSTVVCAKLSWGIHHRANSQKGWALGFASWLSSAALLFGSYYRHHAAPGTYAFTPLGVGLGHLKTPLERSQVS